MFKQVMSIPVKRISQTGNRTPAAAVKAPNPNRLGQISGKESSVGIFEEKGANNFF